MDPVVETVAVNVTLAPTLAGFKLETRVVVVDDSPPEAVSYTHLDVYKRQSA